MEYDLHSMVKVVKGIGATDGQAAGASTVSAIIDTAGFESFEWLIDIGTVTTGDFTLTLEEDDVVGFGTATAVPAANVVGADVAIAAADDDQVRRIGIVGKKQFQRLTVVGINTPVADICVLGLLGNPVTKPVPDQSTTS
jgi:hypothetical protein